MACKAMGIPTRVYRIPNNMAQQAAEFLNKKYGKFSYDHLAKTTFIQTFAQKFRLRHDEQEEKPFNASPTYEKSLIPNYKKGERIFDFGCGQADYVKKHNFTRQYVNKLVNNGTIKLHNGKVNEETADMAIAAIRQPMKTSKNATDGMDALGNLSTVLLKTRIKSEIEKVKYLETKNKEAEKSLVSADGVRIAAFNKGRMVRDALLNIPDRVASILAKETDTNRIHEILTKEIRQIIEEILESG